MTILKDALQQGIRADQPLPGDVGEGTLYFVTDEELTEQSLSGAWEPYSGTAGSGTVTTTGSPASGNLTKFSGVTSIVNGDLSGAVTTSGTLVTTLAAGLSPNFADFSLDSQLNSTFVVQIVNTAGTLQARLMGDSASGGAAGYATKIVNQSNSLVNVPTVAVGQDFSANGLGITTNVIVFNTAAQTVADYFGTVNVEFYNGNVTLQTPRAYAGFVSRNVNGTTRIRLEIYLINALSGAAWTINTTNLPSGLTILVRWTGYLA